MDFNKFFSRLLFAQMFLAVLLVVMDVLSSVFYQNKIILISVFILPITLINLFIYGYFIFYFFKYKLFEMWYYLLLIFPLFYILISIVQLILAYFNDPNLYRIGLLMGFISSIMLMCYTGMSYNKNKKYFIEQE